MRWDENHGRIATVRYFASYVIADPSKGAPVFSNCVLDLPGPIKDEDQVTHAERLISQKEGAFTKGMKITLTNFVEL